MTWHELGLGVAAHSLQEENRMKGFLAIATGMLLAAPALAVDVETIDAKNYAGHTTINLMTGEIKHDSARVGSQVYAAPATVSGGLSSTLTSGSSQVFGDEAQPVYGGNNVLEEFTFAMYNSSSGGGTWTGTTTVTIQFNNFVTSAFVTGFTGSIPMAATWGGTGLAAGYFGELTFTGLGALLGNVALPADLLIQQQFATVTGTTRVGTVGGAATSVGTSIANFYFNGVSTASTAGQVDYKINATPEPASLALLALGGLLGFRRR